MVYLVLGLRTPIAIDLTDLFSGWYKQGVERTMLILLVGGLPFAGKHNLQETKLFSAYDTTFLQVLYRGMHQLCHYSVGITAKRCDDNKELILQTRQALEIVVMHFVAYFRWL